MPSRNLQGPAYSALSRSGATAAGQALPSPARAERLRGPRPEAPGLGGASWPAGAAVTRGRVTRHERPRGHVVAAGRPAPRICYDGRGSAPAEGVRDCSFAKRSALQLVHAPPRRALQFVHLWGPIVFFPALFRFLRVFSAEFVFGGSEIVSGRYKLRSERQPRNLLCSSTTPQLLPAPENQTNRLPRCQRLLR
jgi:hypothetical protein